MRRVGCGPLIEACAVGIFGTTNHQVTWGRLNR